MARKYYHFLRNHHVPLEGVETPPGMIEVMLSIIDQAEDQFFLLSDMRVDKYAIKIFRSRLDHGRTGFKAILVSYEYDEESGCHIRRTIVKNESTPESIWDAVVGLGERCIAANYQPTDVKYITNGFAEFLMMI